MIDVHAIERRLDQLQAAIEAGDTPLETLEAEAAAIGRQMNPVEFLMGELHQLEQTIADRIADGSVAMPRGGLK